ncbi:Uncharacterized protein PECH_004358 [Penicillium ucsense]|uniref:Alkaline phytoceramidase n=1 Tax=Penicillium ucsense TaxID=2839758 RepID=A0A8J8W416_9EURO|nr:Uncharacterized protein PECM_005312 [Penicillium ucsense]KAF7737050.1 Uncharacterized protein PECH_004358 [Penicillium ucsense]
MQSNSVDPFWGPATSYLNFCEEDYAITRYIAEFINTLSSLVFVLFGVYGLRQLREKNAASYRSLLYFGLIGVGVCSAGYHMTLKYHTQMSDELSMHLLTTPLLYRILTFQASSKKTRIVGIVLSVLFVTVMFFHMVLNEFLLHAVTFGTAVLTIAVRTSKITAQQVTDPYMKKKLRNISYFGIFCFAFGFFVWLIDGLACGLLKDTRHAIGLPLAFLTELHGWWHILTAIGGYVAVALVDLVTANELNKGDPIEELAWPIPTAARYIQEWVGPKKEK